MKLFSTVGIGTGTVALGLAFTVALSGTTSANPRRGFVLMERRPVAAAIPRPQLRSRWGATAPTPCSSDDSSGFVGPSDSSDIDGGGFSAVLSGQANEACASDSAIGAGSSNIIGNSGGADGSFIGGGLSNGISTPYAFIGAGYINNVSAPGSFIGAGNFLTYYYAAGGTPGNQITGRDAFIGSGDQNTVVSDQAFIGSGSQNAVNGTASFIGAGQNNTIEAAASNASIAGGARNMAGGEYSAVLGGYGNAARGEYAVVAGGDANQAGGLLSLAAGYHADAQHTGSFVWSDFVSGSSELKDTAENQFAARASGGFYLYSNEAATSGVHLAPGSGTWSSMSDRNAKTDIVSLDDAAILTKVAALPVSGWRYASESGVRHVGPMAQDFYAAFGVGEDDRHITSIDEDGVALAAIKALHRENAQLRTKVRSQDGRLQSMERRLDALESRIRN
jgi:Chaperone of endosialidase